MFSRLLCLFSAPTPPPAGVHIVPCTGVDLAAKDMVLTTGLLVDARLDSKKLETTLSLLIERRFPRAGARLAFRNGAYEFQIPHTFDTKTPAVVFTAEEHPEAYTASPLRPPIDHLIGSHNAASVSEPTIYEVPALESFLRSSTCPSSLEAFLRPNTPLLHVHVVVFDDLTVLGVTSSHVGFDAMGTRALMGAWTRLLSGDALDDIPGMQCDVQPLAPFATAQARTAAVQRGWFDLGFFAQLTFIFHFVLRLVRDKDEMRKVIRIPKPFLEASKRAIMEELRAEGSSDWVGSSDVSLAWWYKMAFAHRTDRTPVHIHIAINLREKPIFSERPESISPPFINNVVSHIALPPVPANELGAASSRDIALRIRRAINGYNADPTRIVEDLRWRCAHPLTMVFPCPPGAEYNIQTSWRIAQFAELDFSGAIAEGEDRLKARVVFVMPMATSRQNTPARSTGIVLMEDENVLWMGQVTGAKEWDAIKRAAGAEFVCH